MSSNSPRVRTDLVQKIMADEDTKADSKPISASLEKIIDQIEKLSVLELADLVHALEDKFGVSASAPVAVATGTASAGSSDEPMEEKTTFNVILSSSGENKISAIKAVRELVPTLGLKEAKDLVEAAPKPVLEGVNKTTAEEAKKKLTEAGGTVELQ
ncbi:MAG: large subunit ribosomal protein L7/L12 [Microgenomates group bacterium Gr01-1014_93]|nr:MAG: large subunit ribosomal protein L7/L12 [Microgenomates group bacterium Gr01-1014_93]